MQKRITAAFGAAFSVLALSMGAAGFQAVPASASSGPIHGASPRPVAGSAASRAGGSTAASRKGAVPDTLSQCSSHPFSLCMWHDAGYAGTFWDYPISIYGMDNWNYVGKGANDRASAIYNNRENSTMVSKTYPQGHDQACISRLKGYPNLAKFAWPQSGTAMNNSISGFNLLSYNAC
jgi:Peptidase inhibitor family I36